MESSRKSRKISLGLEKLEMDGEYLLTEIESFRHMMPESKIKLHLKNMWEKYFKNKILIGKA